jgi:hypothetical protein
MMHNLEKSKADRKIMARINWRKKRIKETTGWPN